MSKEMSKIGRPHILPGASSALSKQSIEAFRFLVDKQAMMHARMIAEQLGVKQQNIYRILKPLVDRGMVRSGKITKTVFKANPMPYARNGYKQFAEREFERLFGDIYAMKMAEEKARNKQLVHGKVSKINGEV